MTEDHKILGAGGHLGQCSKKFISNPGRDLWLGHIYLPLLVYPSN